MSKPKTVGYSQTETDNNGWIDCNLETPPAFENVWVWFKAAHNGQEFRMWGCVDNDKNWWHNYHLAEAYYGWKALYWFPSPPSPKKQIP